MKRVILILLIGCLQVHGQAKQRKELLLQIAALQVYMEYAKKGYSTVKKGLNFIGDIKKGELNFHGDYFNSLKMINPKVKKYYRIGEIISLQLKIIKVSKTTFATIKEDDLFHGDELDYIERSFDRLLDNCNRTLEILLLITTDSELEMKDDQRMERIDELYEMMLSDYNFCRSFSNEAKLLSASKAADKREVESGASMYGLLN